MTSATNSTTWRRPLSRKTSRYAQLHLRSRVSPQRTRMRLEPFFSTSRPDGMRSASVGTWVITPDHSIPLAQALERVHDNAERLRIERAEALVNEDRLQSTGRCAGELAQAG